MEQAQPIKSPTALIRELTGSYNQQTKEDWSRMMSLLHESGLIEMLPDAMQDDLIVRAYQRWGELDQVAHDVIQVLMGQEGENNKIEGWYQKQQSLLNDYLVQGVITEHGYAECMKALVEAKNARLANTHNLLSVVSKAQFQHGQFLNKGMHNAALSRLGRKAYGVSDGDDMSRMQKQLREETDELNLADKGGRVVVEGEAPLVMDAKFTEVEKAMTRHQLDEIHRPADGTE